MKNNSDREIYLLFSSIFVVVFAFSAFPFLSISGQEIIDKYNIPHLDSISEIDPFLNSQWSWDLILQPVYGATNPLQVFDTNATAVDFDVVIEWTNAVNHGATSIIVLRNGTDIASLGLVTNYTDTTVSENENFIYTIFGQNATGNATGVVTNVVETNSIPSFNFLQLDDIDIVTPEVDISWSFDNGAGNPTTGVDFGNFTMYDGGDSGDGRAGIGNVGITTEIKAVKIFDFPAQMIGKDLIFEFFTSRDTNAGQGNINLNYYQAFICEDKVLGTNGGCNVIRNPQGTLAISSKLTYKINTPVGSANGDQEINSLFLTAPTNMTAGETYVLGIDTTWQIAGGGATTYFTTGTLGFNASSTQTIRSNCVVSTLTCPDMANGGGSGLVNWVTTSVFGFNIIAEPSDDNFGIFKNNVTDGGGFQFIQNQSSNFYNDTSVLNFKDYEYIIQGVNKLGATNSTTLPVSVGGQTIPTSISDLTATPVGQDIILNWTLPFNGGGVINGHKILRSVDGGSFITLVANTTSATNSFVDLSLVIGGNYTYDVRALNVFGEALGSNLASAIPFATDPPTKPLNIQLSNVGGNVFIDWDEPSNSPTGYLIERKVEAGGFGVLIADTGSTDTDFTDATVAVATRYTYRVAGINAFGTGVFSDEPTILTTMPPEVPTLMAVQNVNQIDLTWTEPTSDEPINGYQIDRRINFGAFSVFVANTSSTNLIFTDLSITSGNTYGYRLSAHSSLGTGGVSNVVDIEFGNHVVVEVREQDGSSYKGGGTVMGENSTFSEIVALNPDSNAIFNNLDAGLYNFTFFDDDNFVLNKTEGFVFPSPNSTATLAIDALVFDVDCPSNGAGTDVRIKLNYTTLQEITSYPSTPVCDSSDKISWSTTWTGDAGTADTLMVADFISPKFNTNAEQFLSSAITIPTVFETNPKQIKSSPIPITTTSDVTINFDLFLDEAPAQGGSSGSSGTGGSGFIPSIPSQKIVIESRLTGLSVLSRTHPFVMAGDVIESSITVQWIGENPLTVKRIDVKDFTDIIRFDLTPFPVDQSIDGLGEFAMSEGEIEYIITVPPFICDANAGITQNCLDPVLTEIPILFTFTFNDIDYQGETSVLLDLRPIPLDIVQIQIIILGSVLIISALAGNAIRKRFQKPATQSRTRKKRFTKKFDGT